MKRIILFVIFLFYPDIFALADPVITLEPMTCDLGTLSYGDRVKKSVHITNTGTQPLVIKKVRASCPCLSVSFTGTELASGESADIWFIFDTTKKVNASFVKYLYIQSSAPDKPLLRVTISGKLEHIPPESTKNSKEAETAVYHGPAEILFFYSRGCRQCSSVKDTLLPQLSKRYGIRTAVYDINDPDNYGMLIGLEERYRVEGNEAMIVFAGERYFSGKRQIEEELEGYIKESGPLKPIVIDNVPLDRFYKKFASFTPLFMVSAGLIDGINPCAFVTIVFLISLLYALKKKRREIFFAGFGFSLAVFFAYLLIGLGVREFLYRIIDFAALSGAIYALAVVLVFVLGFLSLYDAFSYFRYGKGDRFKLKLPRRLVQRIHELLRNSLKAERLFLSVFAAGFLIAFIESVCTGQVYIPAIMFMVKEEGVSGRSFLYLLLYNMAFVIPLLLVSVVAAYGAGSKKWVSFSERNTLFAKVMLALLYFTLGIVLVLVG